MHPGRAPTERSAGNGVAAFSTGVVSQITGVSADRLKAWHGKGLLEPSIAGPDVRRPRSGGLGRPPGATNRRYSLDDLVLAVLVRELLASGLSVERARAAVLTLRGRLGDRSVVETWLDSRLRLAVFRNKPAELVPADRVWVASAARPQAAVGLSRVVRLTRELLGDWHWCRHVQALQPRTASREGGSPAVWRVPGREPGRAVPGRSSGPATGNWASGSAGATDEELAATADRAPGRLAMGLAPSVSG